ncbi:MAG: endopeptidase La [bacterium]|nr:endopeptidase La [bacterium]MDT8365230.1 endopeptidase La [bacterium]
MSKERNGIIEEGSERGSGSEGTVIPEVLPLLPIRDIVVFPYMIVPLVVGREKSIRALDEALKGDRLIFLTAQQAGDLEEPGTEDLHELGTVSIIIRMLKTPDGKAKILVQGLQRGQVAEFLQTDPFFSVRLDLVNEELHEPPPLKIEAMVRAMKEGLMRIVELGKPVPPDVLSVAGNVDDPGRLADLIGSSLGLSLEEAQQVLGTIDPYERLEYVHEILDKELKINEMQQKIHNQAQEEMSKTQKDYYLRQQLKAIQQELGDKDDREVEIEGIRESIEKAGMPVDVKQEVGKQLDRLAKMHPDSAEASTVRTYLDWIVEIPWKKSTKDKLDLRVASDVLNEDHYDLEKIKERILEYLGVLKLKKELKGPILCLVGPPGVGKTSLGKSIARAMGRQFIRMSLGGVRDEAEIRGHRRTYVGALPGRIIQGMKQAGSRNPVFMLDEIDKLGSDFRGDPSSALLEVLDPEQNHNFRDHYLAVPYDLSAVMFIATANMADPIPQALRDRMEIIQLSGYTAVEKRHIARRYLVDRQLDRNGLTPELLSLSDGALDRIITEYTREAGVRNLEREIGSVCRKVAKAIALGKKTHTVVTARNLDSYLGVPRFRGARREDEARIGVSVGLAWTPVGGDTLNIEVSAVKGNGTLTLTGSLGDVMKESAQASLSYIRSRGNDLGVTPQSILTTDIHVHVPAGATFKDGPSAGIAITSAMISSLTGKLPLPAVAMTGEITLTGRVLPIGGLREKLLAAKRASINKVIIPSLNLPDLKEIPSYVTRGIQIVPVKDMDEALSAIFKKDTFSKTGRSGKARSLVKGSTNAKR